MLKENNYKIICSNRDKNWGTAFESYFSIAALQLKLGDVGISDQCLSNAYNILVVSEHTFKDDLISSSFTKVVADKKVKIHLVLLSEIALPLQTQNIKISRFFDFNNELGVFQVYAADAGQILAQKFCAKVLDLAYELSIAENIEDDVSKKAFVAQTTADQFHVRDNVCWELQKQGYKVLTPDNNVHNDCQFYIEQLIQDCSLCVHIIGSLAGQIDAETGESVLELQIQASTQLVKAKNIKRVIYIAQNVQPLQLKHSEFIAKLKTGEGDPNTEILQAPVDELLGILSQNKTSEPSFSQPEGVKKQYTYIIADIADAVICAEVADYLKQKGLDIVVPLFRASGTEIIKHHKHHLSHAKQIVIWYASGSEQWLKSKFNDLLKAPGYGRVQAFENVVLLNTRGNLPEKIRIPQFCNEIKIMAQGQQLFETCYQNLSTNGATFNQ